MARSIQAQRFRDSNFVIVPIRRNDLGDQNLKAVEEEVLAFQYALLLKDCGYCSGGLQVCGNTDNGLQMWDTAVETLERRNLFAVIGISRVTGVRGTRV